MSPLLESIAFIPDGNRRFAQKMNMPLAQAYALGTQKAWEVVEWISSYPGIATGTFYTLSLENLQRSKEELNVLFKIFDKELEKVFTTDFFERNGIALKFMGRLNAFPKPLREKMERAQKETENNAQRTIHLALAYNGRTEILDAAKRLAREAKENKVDIESLNEESFKNYLYSPLADPDMIIRTSGTQRLSGFLAYQSVYSELYFCPKYWPEFSREDLTNAIAEFEDRARRFGK
ncbi:MAG: di-trans,poly-cis-decaprenylcistransferase [Candidatus Diapherotrites archaeon]|nr:di-trans,poly-cis-decaprenylcistransferase [Candidatus Diapherotrites archaeon]